MAQDADNVPGVINSTEETTKRRSSAHDNQEVDSQAADAEHFITGQEKERCLCRIDAYGYLAEKYLGIWGAKVFWLAIFSLAPLFIGLKFFAVEVSATTIIYAIYHFLGIFIWAAVNQCANLKVPFSMRHGEKWLKRYQWVNKYVVTPLYVCTLAGLISTFAAKVILTFGPMRGSLSLPVVAYRILGVDEKHERNRIKVIIFDDMAESNRDSNDFNIDDFSIRLLEMNTRLKSMEFSIEQDNKISYDISNSEKSLSTAIALMREKHLSVSALDALTKPGDYYSLIIAITSKELPNKKRFQIGTTDESIRCQGDEDCKDRRIIVLSTSILASFSDSMRRPRANDYLLISMVIFGAVMSEHPEEVPKFHSVERGCFFDRNIKSFQVSLEKAYICDHDVRQMERRLWLQQLQDLRDPFHRDPVENIQHYADEQIARVNKYTTEQMNRIEKNTTEQIQKIDRTLSDDTEQILKIKDKLLQRSTMKIEK